MLYDYGFQDNITDWPAFSVPWAELLASLEAAVKQQRCVTTRKCAAYQLTFDPATAQYMVATTKGVFRADAVVIATDIHTVQLLLPGVPAYTHIHGQPFLRIYATVGKHSKSSALLRDAVKGVTIVRGPLQKVIAMSNTVYMIAYSDNASALYLKDNALGSKFVLARLLEQALGLPPKSLTLRSVRAYFHEAGTHFNDSGLHEQGYSQARLQRPLPNVFVVGEAVSQHQGWVEGVLESVDAVIG